MDEPKNAGATPESNASENSQNPTNADGDAGKQSAKPQTVEDLTAELSRIQAALKSANNESASRRKKLDEYEAKEKKAQQAQLSEVEQYKGQLAQAQAQIEQMKQEHTNALLRNAVEREAVKQGFTNPEDAFLLAKMDGVEMDDDGKISGIEAALKTLLKERPYLAQTSKSTPPNTNARDASKGPQVDETARRKEIAQRFRIKI